jgi:hypothetical protein
VPTNITPTKFPGVVIVHRSEAEAARAGNTYTARAECVAGNGCRYKSKWTGLWHAEDLATAHRCNR